MRIVGLTEYRHGWRILPLVALGWLLLPDRTDPDRGILRLASAGGHIDAAAWHPAAMHALSDLHVIPVVGAQSPDMSVSDQLTDNARRTLGSIMPKDSALPFSLPPSERGAAANLDQPSGLLDFPAEESAPQFGLSRPGWLAERVQAAGEGAVEANRPSFPDFSDILETHVFGDNQGFLDRSDGTGRRADAGVFDDQDDRLFQSPGTTEKSGGEGPADLGLFKSPEGLQ
jgi:hypothetical protein